MTTKTLMTRAVTFAREIKATTECDTDELREVLEALMPCLMGEGLDDVTMTLGGSEWRFIRQGHEVEIAAEELENFESLGYFNASFLAAHTTLSMDIIKALQEGEKWDALSAHIAAHSDLTALVEDYFQHDSSGHHFAHYDHVEHELNSEGFYAYKIG